MASTPFSNAKGEPYVSTFDASSYQNLDPEFQRRFQAAIAAAEGSTGQPAQINSTFRSRDEQAQAYANYMLGQTGQKQWTDPDTGQTYTAQHVTSLAAYPGNSYHEVGQAADVQPGADLDWLHKNAGDYGLEFLQGSAFTADPVHMQLARGSQAPQVPPPLPNLRPFDPGAPAQVASGAPSSAGIYANGAIAGGLPPVQLASFNPSQPSADVRPATLPTTAGTPPTPAAAPAAPMPAPNNQQEGGGGYSTYGKVPQAYGEMQLNNLGPMGFGELLNAITSGDITPIIGADGQPVLKADGTPMTNLDVIGKGIQDRIDKLPAVSLFGPNKAGTLVDLNNYISNAVPKEAPGTVRYLKEAFATDPKLKATIPGPLKDAVDAAFKSQLPPQTTVPYAMPNLRPPMPSGTPAQAPLVAANPQISTAPKMAAFTPPQPDVGTLIPKDQGPSFDNWPSDPEQFTPPPQQVTLPPRSNQTAPDLSKLMNYPTQQGGSFAPTYQTAYTPPTVQPTPAAGSTLSGNALLGFGAPLSSSAFAPTHPAGFTSGTFGQGAYVANGLPGFNWNASSPGGLTAQALVASAPKPNMRPQQQAQPQTLTQALVGPPPQMPAMLTAQDINSRAGTAATQGLFGATKEQTNAQLIADALNSGSDLPDLDSMNENIFGRSIRG